MKKKIAMGAYVALVYGIILSWMLTGCTSGIPERADRGTYPEPEVHACDWEYLGRIGRGKRGDFDLFKFTVDGKTFIAGSEYEGGLDIIQIND
jgi:hypothetical protein